MLSKVLKARFPLPFYDHLLYVQDALGGEVGMVTQIPFVLADLTWVNFHGG